MWIEIKNSRRGDPLFIFNFESVDERVDYMTRLKLSADNYSHVSGDELIVKVVNRLDSRIDDKYANDEVALSGFLFGNEFCHLATIACMHFAVERNDLSED